MSVYTQLDSLPLITPQKSKHIYLRLFLSFTCFEGLLIDRRKDKNDIISYISYQLINSHLYPGIYVRTISFFSFQLWLPFRTHTGSEYILCTGLVTFCCLVCRYGGRENGLLGDSDRYLYSATTILSEKYTHTQTHTLTHAHTFNPTPS